MSQESDYFEHPNRFPGNAAGPFYTTGHPCKGEEKFNGLLGDCLQCEAPEHEAPELLAELNDDNSSTYFVRQPSTSNEIEHACNAILVCCVAALRYGGTNRAIIQRLGNSPECCDYVIDENDELKLTIGNDGELLPFANSIVVSIQQNKSETKRVISKEWAFRGFLIGALLPFTYITFAIFWNWAFTDHSENDPSDGAGVEFVAACCVLVFGVPFVGGCGALIGFVLSVARESLSSIRKNKNPGTIKW